MLPFSKYIWFSFKLILIKLILIQLLLIQKNFIYFNDRSAKYI